MHAVLDTYTGMLHQGHVYIFCGRAQTPVWVGKKTQVDRLGARELAALVEYRLAFDKRCCRRVN